MESKPSERARILQIAAWMWVGYLLALVAIDFIMYANSPRPMLQGYYLGNGIAALAFLALAYWPWFQQTLKRFYVPAMLILISCLPLALGRVIMPPLPPGPMSNIEGITLRMLPISFLALMVAAWLYPWKYLILFALGTAGLEILILEILPRPLNEEAYQAVVFIAIVRSVSFLVVGYFTNQLVHRLQEQQDKLAQANVQLTLYATTLEKLTISRERNRLARELHDTLAHTLSGLSVQLETASAYWDVKPETARQLLAQSLVVTRSGLDETRRALKALRASPLDDLGLWLALRTLAEAAAERGKLHLELDLPPKQPALAPDVEQCIYRVAQEALENVLTHANAQNLSVRMELQGEEVCLTVQDDGLGLDLEQAEQVGHYGLAGMRERAELAGGQMEIDSQPGKGMCVRLRLNGMGRYANNHL